MHRIIADFLVQARAAATDELAVKGINDAVSNGATPTMLRTGIASLSIKGQNLKRPFGEEAASPENTLEFQNLRRVSGKLDEMFGCLS
jgi:hypothetical protein